MAEPRDIDQRIGLDYLRKAGKLPEPESEAPEPTPSAGQAYQADLHAFAARSVLRSLQKLEDAKGGGGQPGIRLSAIGDDIGMSAEVLLPLSRVLESAQLVRTLERNTFGDNLVTLTEDARQLLAADSVELLRRLRSASGV